MTRKAKKDPGQDPKGGPERKAPRLDKERLKDLDADKRSAGVHGGAGGVIKDCTGNRSGCSL
jgi:hypothetical protein